MSSTQAHHRHKPSVMANVRNCEATAWCYISAQLSRSVVGRWQQSYIVPTNCPQTPPVSNLSTIRLLCKCAMFCGFGSWPLNCTSYQYLPGVSRRSVFVEAVLRLYSNRPCPPSCRTIGGWLGGVVVRELDMWPRDREFDSSRCIAGRPRSTQPSIPPG